MPRSDDKFDFPLATTTHGEWVEKPDGRLVYRLTTEYEAEAD